MSTRSVVTIKTHGSGYEGPGVALYTHYDGYVAGVGAVVAAALVGATTVEDVVARLFEHRHSDGRRLYEFTESPETHGDIEYVYEVKLSPDPAARDAFPYVHRVLARVNVYERTRAAWDANKEWFQWPVKTFATLDEFVAFVNTERAAIRARIVERAEKYGRSPDVSGWLDVDVNVPVAGPARIKAEHVVGLRNLRDALEAVAGPLSAKNRVEAAEILSEILGSLK